MEAAEGNTQFSKLRSFFWPVHRHELKKFIPMLLMFFLITFDYNVLRGLKDAIVITAKDAGAEVIPFIKVWAMFPTSILLTYFFVRLSNRFSCEKVFYIMLSFFLVYFFAFAFFLYPIRESLHAYETGELLQQMLPKGLKGFVSMYRYWIFTSFYVMAELWSNIVLSLLFWGFANQVTQLDEAKRFYGLFGLGVNFSGIAAGLASISIAKIPQYTPLFGQDTWAQSMTVNICLVLVAGILTLFVFRWFNRHCLPAAKQELHYEPGGTKKKFSMRENLRYVCTSSYVLSIAVIIIAYNLIINLVEVMWKDQARELYPDPLAYNLFQNEITTITGITATIAALFVSGVCLRKFGWTFTAMLTPMILLITSIGFFGFFFLKESSLSILHFTGASPLMLVVFFGSLQNCFSRAAKYTVFDATKEMAFIPLPAAEKVKAKAAIDGVCNRLGKSTGSVIYNVLLLSFSSIAASVPYVGIFLFFALILWIMSIRFLGRKFNTLVQKEPSPTYCEDLQLQAAQGL
ncbi:MAG: NTP/NDP exchange transporter [Verrucomicrobia bacterium]|nr:NTP/NDP exchange transporter [Verrucomicrobiota bacterium]